MGKEPRYHPGGVGSSELEVDKATRTRRSELHYRAKDGRTCIVDVYAGEVTVSVKLHSDLNGEEDPFPDSPEDVHMMRIRVEEMQQLLAAAGFTVDHAVHRWV